MRFDATTKKKWKSVPLGSVCTITSSKRIFAREYTSFGIPFYRGKEVIEKHSGKSISTELFISTERFEEIKRKFGAPQIGDILLTSVGTLGVPWLVDEEDFYFKDGNLTWLRSGDKLLNKYLFLWLNSPDAQHQIDAKCIGSTQKALTIETLNKFYIPLPSISEQKRICAAIYPLIEKIELNQRINEILQQQAQTLFKEWFIDNPDSVLWQEGTFSNLIERTISGDWGKDGPSGNNTEMVYCIRGADIPDVRTGNKGKMPTRYILPKNYTAKQLVHGDIVVEISGGSPTQSTGRAAAISTALLNRYDKGMICTNFCKALKPIAGYGMYVYYYWLYLYDMGVFFSYENGTTGIKNLDINGFIETETISIAPADLVKKFDIFCQSVFSTVYANGLENQQLSILRDTILPKLMTGEIDVSHIQL